MVAEATLALSGSTRCYSKEHWCSIDMMQMERRLDRHQGSGTALVRQPGQGAFQVSGSHVNLQPIPAQPSAKPASEVQMLTCS